MMTLPSPAGEMKLSMFLRRDAGHRLEPVRKVGYTFFDCPIFHHIPCPDRGLALSVGIMRLALVGN